MEYREYLKLHPTVSIVIPVYNSEKYIKNTLESLFNQSFTDFEIIVVDDGSTDNTPNILKNYADKITYIRQENSGGPSSPRNRGIKLAKGEYIALFDSDDLMFENKIQSDVNILDNNPDVSLVFSNFIVLEDEKLWSFSWFEKENVKEMIGSIPKKKIAPNAYRFERPIYKEILQNNFIGTSTVVLRKKDILEVGLFDKSLFGVEDRDMWLKFSKAGKIFAMNADVLSYYRLLSSSLSRQTKHLISRIDFYNRLLKNESKIEYKKIAKRRLGDLYLAYGFALRNERNFLSAIRQNIKSFFCLDFNKKYRPIIAIGKILILIIAPRFSGSLSKT